MIARRIEYLKNIIPHPIPTQKSKIKKAITLYYNNSLHLFSSEIYGNQDRIISSHINLIPDVSMDYLVNVKPNISRYILAKPKSVNILVTNHLKADPLVEMAK
ncbi:hypothetical protein FGO68_gene13851 [Halteria grandinella]|uniref:Uncharacterized protein n=1 Tax=Halteria grandinella TaxID=5974 RepID=A0A8J8P4G9_HALGN|nr:hypothetical protein FGO68_gene13851 [Halteria grandinella]